MRFRRKISKSSKGQLGITGQELAAATILITGVFTMASTSPEMIQPGMGDIPTPKLNGELGNNTLNNLKKMGMNGSDLKNISNKSQNLSKLNSSSKPNKSRGGRPEWVDRVENKGNEDSGEGNRTGETNRSGRMNKTLNQSIDNNQSELNFSRESTEREEKKDQEKDEKEQDEKEEEKEQEEQKEQREENRNEKESDSSGSGSGGATSGLSPNQNNVGGSVSLSNEVVAIVESPETRKLRMAGYDEYSGDGWNRNYGTEDYSEPVIKSEGEKLVQEVTLNRTLESIVAAWRPQKVEGVDTKMQVSEDGRIQLSEPLEAGDSYTVTSTTSRPSVSEMKSSGSSYSEEIREKYTKLPDSVPDRVGEKTDEILDGEETSYDKVKEIEEWFSENKNYSLDAPDNPEGMGLAEHFIFNTDRGYCSYFATTSVVMLRSQDIPARYVSGYGGASMNDNGNYVIRKKHAHAWIEVYFPGEGWVSFDPTSGSSEEYQEAHKSQEEQPEKDDIEEKQEEEEQQEAKQEEEEKQEKKEEQNDQQKKEPEPEYSLELVTEDPTPGANAEVRLKKTVEDETTAIADTQILVEDQQKTTSEEGTVSTDVPYEEWFNASYPEEEAKLGVELETEIDVEADRRIPGSLAEVTAEIGDVPVDSGTVSLNEQYRTTTENGSANVTLPWEKEANISVTRGEASGETTVEIIDDVEIYKLNRTLPSRETTFGVKIRDKPVENAVASFNDSELGKTSSEGLFTAEMPSKPGNYTYRFSRRELSGSTRVEIENLTVEAESKGALALPGSKTLIRVKVGQEPAGNVAVSYSGSRTTTNEEGIATVSNPLKNSVNFSTKEYGQEASDEVSNLLLNLGVVLLGLGGLLGLVSHVLYSRGFNLEEIRKLAEKLKDRGIGLLVDAAILIGERVSETIQKMFQALKHPEIAVQSLKQRFQAASTIRNIGSDSETHVGVDEAWNVLKQNTSMRKLSYQTPGEIKRHAIGKDKLPEEAVAEIVDAFRGEKYAHRKLETDFSSYVEQLNQSGVSS